MTEPLTAGPLRRPFRVLYVAVRQWAAMGERERCSYAGQLTLAAALEAMDQLEAGLPELRARLVAESSAAGAA